MWIGRVGRVTWGGLIFWNGNCSLCSCRVGGGTDVGSFCGFHTAVCLVVEWEELQGLVNLWNGYW
jgi:hypothetical protein